MVGLQCLDCYFMVGSYFVYSLATQKSNRRFSDLDDEPRSSPSASASAPVLLRVGFYEVKKLGSSPLVCCCWPRLLMTYLRAAGILAEWQFS